MKRSTWQQVAIWTVGLLVTGVMVFLGLWQMDRFREQGQDKLIARLSEPAVELSEVAPAGQVPGDSYGRTVNAHGSYLPEQQVLVPEREPGRFRVVAALRLDDGSVLPVVRGITSESTPPPPPPGRIDATGVFLPTEPEPESTAPLPEGQIGSVRLPLLAQVWPQEITGGFLALDQAQATEQQLVHWQFDLPSNAGQARSNGYALQWWAFAAAAVAGTVKLSRDARKGTGFMVSARSAESSGEAGSGAVGTTGNQPNSSVGTDSTTLSTAVDNSVEKPVGGVVDEPGPGVDERTGTAPEAADRTGSAGGQTAGTVDKAREPVSNIDELSPVSVDNQGADVDNFRETGSDKQE